MRQYLGILAITALGFAGAADAQEARDMRLEDAGFVMRPADTPKKMERIRRLPPRTFVARTTPQGRYYLYSEPDFCKCVFAGGEKAMQAFRDMVARGNTLPRVPNVAPRGVTPENDIIREMDLDDSTLDPDDILNFTF
ncbi:MAG: hypothetical protein ACTHLY_10090 [Pseudolabrys sp.]